MHAHYSFNTYPNNNKVFDDSMKNYSPQMQIFDKGVGGQIVQ